MERRIAIVEEHLAGLDATVAGIRSSLHAGLDDVRLALVREAETRAAEVATLHQRLGAVTVDGLASEIFGVVLVVLGQVLGTFPAEVAAWLSL